MPTQATFRRDPRNTGKGFSTRDGFTVIELMITIAVIAIITSLALPSYRTILEKRQVTSGAEQLSAFLSSAQIEAVKRNDRIAVSYSRADTDSWCVGMVAVEDDCDCTVTDTGDADACVVDGALRVFTDANLNYPGIMSGMNGDGTFVYDPVRGLMVDLDDAATLELESGEGNYALDVQVTVTGRVKICSSASDQAVPGFPACADA